VARLRRAGASVTKLEPPAGDPFVELSPAWYAEMHEGIEVERLDLKSERGP
jgi:alpha-methylacyl-CoA racemase